MHFFALVLVPSDTDNVDHEVASLLEPYNENGEARQGGHWDWWQFGGRWTGVYDPEYNPEEDAANKRMCSFCGGTGYREDSVADRIRENNPDFGCNACEDSGVQVLWPTEWGQAS